MMGGAGGRAGVLRVGINAPPYKGRGFVLSEGSLNPRVWEHPFYGNFMVNGAGGWAGCYAWA